MRFYVLPNPINVRIGFPETLELVRELNVQLKGPKFYVESTAYQEALVQSAKRDTIDVTGVKPSQDKPTRLNMIADKIQRGIILFPEHGCKDLLTQLVGFGIEKHDDLVDALTIAIIEAVRNDITAPRIWIGTHNFYKDLPGLSTPSRGRSYWNRRLDDWEEATSGEWD
jgi:predicted phage terminase large subunit-like protein